MNRRFNSLVYEKLRDHCEAVYLYGSQVISDDVKKDIDIAIVCNIENKTKISREINTLQNKVEQLIHPIFIMNSDIERNPGFRCIVTDGYRIV